MQDLMELNHGELTDTALQLLEDEDLEKLHDLLEQMHPAEMAQVFESIPSSRLPEMLGQIESEQQSLALPFLSDAVRHRILGEMDASQLSQVAESLSASDLAEMLDDLPESKSDAILASLDEDNLARLHAALDYPEDTAGRLMSTDVLSVRPTTRLGVVLRWLRRQDGLPPYTTALMVTDSAGKYLGMLPMGVVVTEDPEIRVESVMQPSSEFIRASATEHEVAQLFDQRHLIDDTASRRLAR